MGPHVQEVAAAARVPTIADVSLQTPRDVAARSKLAELKRESRLREIGRESCPAGPADGEIDLVVSELCMASMSTSPTADFDGSETCGPMPPGEDMVIPLLKSTREQAGAFSRNQDEFDPGPAACNTELSLIHI